MLDTDELAKIYLDRWLSDHFRRDYFTSFQEFQEIYRKLTVGEI